MALTIAGKFREQLELDPNSSKGRLQYSKENVGNRLYISPFSSEFPDFVATAVLAAILERREIFLKWREQGGVRPGLVASITPEKAVRVLDYSITSQANPYAVLTNFFSSRD